MEVQRGKKRKKEKRKGKKRKGAGEWEVILILV